MRDAERVRLRLIAVKLVLPPVVLSSVLRSVCNAWITSGRFAGPTLPCPFGCGLPEGDRFAHFPVCVAIRDMWGRACPCSHPAVLRPTLEHVLLISPDLPTEAVVQLALWSDVIGYCVNDARAMGSSPDKVLREGEGMILARFRPLGVQSDSTRNVIAVMRDSTRVHQQLT